MSLSYVNKVNSKPKDLTHDGTRRKTFMPKTSFTDKYLLMSLQ